MSCDGLANGGLFLAACFGHRASLDGVDHCEISYLNGEKLQNKCVKWEYETLKFRGKMKR